MGGARDPQYFICVWKADLLFKFLPLNDLENLQIFA